MTIAQIENSTFCNHKCWYCQNAYLPTKPSRSMPMDLFNLILDRIEAHYTKEHLSEISFATYQEPPLDPLFRERLLELTRRNFRYWFFSNAFGITPDLTKFLVRERIAIAFFAFNLPAIDADAYTRLVGAPQRNIALIRENLDYLFAHLDALGANVKMVVHGDNSPDHVEQLRRMHEFVAGRERVSVVKAGVMDRAGMLKGVGRLAGTSHNGERIECMVHHLDNLYVGIDGNVYLCAHDFHQESTFGSLTTHSIAELLGSTAREVAVNRYVAKFCQQCVFATPVASATLGTNV